MKLTIGEILGIDQGVEEIMKEKIPVVLAFKLMRVRKIIEGDVSTFRKENERLIREFGRQVKDAPEGAMEVIPAKRGYFMEEIAKIQAVSVELADLEKIGRAELDGISVPGVAVMNLMPIITE